MLGAAAGHLRSNLETCEHTAKCVGFLTPVRTAARLLFAQLVAAILIRCIHSYWLLCVMQIAVLLAVVAAVTISENAPHRPVPLELERLALALSAMGFVVLFAVASSVSVATSLRPDRDSLKVRLEWFDRLKRVHSLLWLAVVAIVLYTLNWSQLVRYNWGLDRAILLRDVVVFVPVWLPWILSWAAFYEVERSLQRVLHPEAAGAAWIERVRFVWLQTRQWLGLVLLPVLVLLAVEELVTLWDPGWLPEANRWWVYAVLLAGILLAFPVFLKWLWDTVPIVDAELRERLQVTSERLGIRCREFRQWNTGYRVLNAAVAGLVPAVRCVFFTDALLKHLDDDSIEAVFLHELGHIRRHHLPLRIMLLGLPLWLGGCVHVLVPSALVQISAGNLGRFWNGQAAVTAMLLPCAITAYAVFVLGWYSRLLEFDADLYVSEQKMTPAFLDALESLARLSGEPVRQRSWLHPSIYQRMQRLLLADVQPDYAVSFRRRLDLVARGLVLTWIAIPVLTLALSALMR